MGAPDEPGYTGNNIAGPTHKVTIAKPFAVGRFSVTFEEWDACVADKGCNFIRPPDEGWGRGRRPVINVSWDDAKLYVAWLSKKTGKPYRLPSEAEREYVMRAGTSSLFWTGDSISKTQANYGDYDHGKTVPVDSLAPNPWGLYQMTGNVHEWVEDCDQVNYKLAPSDGSAYVVGNESGRRTMRVYRGGSWGSGESSLRSASREWAYPNTRDKTIGFRVASDF
jgi:formylglycine-generating enzyme required for sulfatase activity